ncbi:bifunctional DedA family/phosphatase PAP2 family protein [Marinobacter sp. BGYM27]|uniref:bifunctional DedA family/phosphatase PAP2 family protein n=1 Tax=Marinobacter sp. BGYM27 TaxID=2975597 RepID=UPI0021A2EF9E|nr:bifunctional DedA family/phosphatase PAP2 family protein [Marinobacter sp. BGYM27]MDG5498146.1 bifunctional DedA family/phosphatase PAP2 family protein [Marinobacter sp. BGYM27]
MAWFEALITWLTAHPDWLTLSIFLIAFVESLAIAGVIVPGVAMMFAAATLAGKIAMPLPEALLWAGLGAIAGDGISFWLGRHFQGRLDIIWPFSRYPKLIDGGERFFRRHGGKGVIIGRFVGPIRPVIPLVAGAFQMPARRFFLCNVISAIGWAPTYVVPGYLVGSAMSLDIDLPPHFYPVLLASLAILASLYLVFFRLQWGLSGNGLTYQWLESVAKRSRIGRNIWIAMSSEGPHGREFPLPSIMLALGCGALFALWALLSMETHAFDTLNQATQTFFSELRHPLPDRIAVTITLLGDPLLLTLCFTAGIILFLAEDLRAAALHLIAAGVAVTLFTTMLKAGFAIERPTGVELPPSSFSFPSGHASGVTVAYGMAATFVAQQYHRSRRWSIYLWFSLPIVLIAMSRLYLGVHWFTDVIGGILLGLSICGLTRASFSRFNGGLMKQTPLTRVGIGIIGITAIAYVALALPGALIRYAVIN